MDTKLAKVLTYRGKLPPLKPRELLTLLLNLQHSGIVYRLEKNKKDNIKVHVDLTKKRHSLLKSASNLVMLIGFYLVTLM